jgi:hypothetical protein
MATSQYFEDSRGGELLTAAAVSVPTTAIGLEIDLGASGWGFDLGRVSPEATAMIVPILSKTRADDNAGGRRRWSDVSAKVLDEFPDWLRGTMTGRDLVEEVVTMPTNLQEQIGVKQGANQEPFIDRGLIPTVV